MSHYFFTDIAKLSTQIANNEFGPAGVTTSPIHDKYRVTSLHKASEDVKAYAVCKGILFVQEQSNNANLVNIVLKPLEQPPFNLPKVKFYIYKGVKKSSLIDGNNIATDTDLYDSIILDYAALNTGATTAPKEILGITASVLTTDSISSVFSEANFDHQLPVVNAGSSIGVFDKDGFGFEIHLEAFGFEPAIAQARTHENIILVPQLPSTPTQAEFFEHWHDKEAILNYLDPCAFWGSFFDVGIKVFSSAIPPPNPNPALKKESTLVTEVLAKFTNKNKVYIDIRNEFNFSINYFKNYGTSATNNTTDVKLTKVSNTQTTVDYYGNNWPVLILDGTGFGTTSTNHQVLGISLPCGNGDNPEPVVYLEKANFSGAKFPQEFSGVQRFVELSETLNYTQVFNLGLYWSSGLVSNYLQLKFSRNDNLASSQSPITSQLKREHGFDCVFRINSGLSFTNAQNRITAFNDGVYLDFDEQKHPGSLYKFVIAEDYENVIFMRVIEDSIQTQSLKIPQQYCSAEYQGNFYNRLDYYTPSSRSVKANYSDNTNIYEVIHSVEVYNKVSSNLWEADLDSSLILLLSRSEATELLSKLNASSSTTKKFPIFLSLSQPTALTDTYGLLFYRSEITLKGFELSGSNIQTVNISLNNPIYLYSYANI